MGFPRYCGHCTMWQPEEFTICPACGRSLKGRICRKCKTEVPTHALFCTNCAGSTFIEPATKPLNLSRKQRIALAVVTIVIAGLLISVLPSLLMWVAELGFMLAIDVAAYVLTFLILTAFLPQPIRGHVRGGVVWCLKFIGRIIANCFH